MNRGEWRVRADAVLTSEGIREDGVVELDPRGRILDVRAARREDPPAHAGLVLPGLVNAHTHLELSHLAGAVPGGRGFVEWAGSLMAQRRALEADAPPDAIREATWRAAIRLVELGTAVVSDVGNGGRTGGMLSAVGLLGVVQVEFLTLDVRRVSEVRARVEACGGTLGGGRVRIRPAVHALYSSAPDLVAAAVAARGPGTLSPASLHVAESSEELRFLRDGTGPFVELLDRLGVDWSWWSPPGGTPVSALDELGVLGSRLLAVHGVHLSGEDRQKLARSHTPLCLCPRSNRYIGGTLPDVPALLEQGVMLCLGTDSLASSPDLDLLGEIAVLAEAFPSVPVEEWLYMATRNGAEALGFSRVGSIRIGASPDLLLLEGVGSLDRLRRPGIHRRWLFREAS